MCLHLIWQDEQINYNTDTVIVNIMYTTATVNIHIIVYHSYSECIPLLQ